MDKNINIIGDKIRKASNKNLIKLIAEHYITKRLENNGGLLSPRELEIAIDEANKRRIARKIDIILRAETSIFFTKVEINEASLMIKYFSSYIEKYLEKYKTIGEIYTYLPPKNEDQQEYRDAIIKNIKPKKPSIIDSFSEKDPTLLALDTQIRKLKKIFVLIKKLEEWADYPIVRGEIEELIKENRLALGVLLENLENLTSSLFICLGEDETDFKKIVYRLSFYSLSKSDQEQFKKLYEDIDLDLSFLTEEDTIAELLNGKEELTQEAKEKLAELFVEKTHDVIEEEKITMPPRVINYLSYLIVIKTTPKEEFNQILNTINYLSSYFANIPLKEVVRRWVERKGLDFTKTEITSAEEEGIKHLEETSEEDKNKTRAELLEDIKILKTMKKYAKENNIAIKKILKEGFLDWLNEDLFKEHPPLVLTEYKDLFYRWIKAKEEMTKKLKELIEKGELKTTDNGKSLLRESFYNLKDPVIRRLLEEGFYRENKEFRSFIEEEIGVNNFINFLSKLNSIIKTHIELSEEEKKFIELNENNTNKGINYHPYKDIPFENRGLTAEDYKEINELLKIGKGEYAEG